MLSLKINAFCSLFIVLVDIPQSSLDSYSGRPNLPSCLNKSEKLPKCANNTVEKSNDVESPEELWEMEVSPKDIFQGDTVTMTCTRKLPSRNVTWYHSGHLISSSSRYSTTVMVTNATSTARLTVASVSQSDTGEYTCSFTEWNEYKLAHVQYVNVSPIHIMQSENIEFVCNGDVKELTCCTEREIQLFTVRWTTNGTINISGSATTTSNCTKYQLRATESQCPVDKSGTETTYTCELHTAYGAHQSKDIIVTYLRAANVTLTSSKSGNISEGYNFSLRCISGVSNFDKVTWQIQAGNSTKQVDRMRYTTTKTFTGAESILTVDSANQEWAGIYTCTFLFPQRMLRTSANMSIEVFPLPLRQDIIIDPMEAFSLCRRKQVLKCCTRRTENYMVTFTVSHPRLSSIQAERRQDGDLTCYRIDFLDDFCNSSGLAFSISCQFANQIQGTVQSSSMILYAETEKKHICNSDVIGVGNPGATTTKPCLSSYGMSDTVRGNITYKCDNEKWNIFRNSCLILPVNELLIAAESLVSSPESMQQLPKFLKNLSSTTEKEQRSISNSAANLGAVVEILNLVSTIPTAAEQEIVDDFFYTVNIIISCPTIETWKNLKNESSQLLDSVERFSRSLQPVNSTLPNVRYNNLQVKSMVITGGDVSAYERSFAFFSSSHLNGSVLIDRAEIATWKPNSTVISVAYSTLRHVIPQYNKKDESVVNSLVITTTMSSGSSQNPDFQIVMTFTKNDKSLKNPRCVFWNYSFAGDRAGWDVAGCETTDYGDRVTCSCNHLTSFAILMSPSDEKPEAALYALDYLSYVGVSVSILSLLACIGIEGMVWKSVTKTRISYMRHICILNVSLSLLIADVWFLVVAALRDKDHQVDPKLCTAAAFFIHFFYLCVFFWMLTLALMIFYHLVFILQNASKTIMKAVGFCLGYGCPLAISAITLVSTYPTEYTRENSCLLKWENSKALLALVTPAMVIVFINVIVTLVVIAKIPRRSIGEKSINEDRSSLYRITKCVGVLTPLLGLTWGFGLVTVIPGSPRVFYVLFTLFNASQGFFILLCGTLWDRKIREILGNMMPYNRRRSQHPKSPSEAMSIPMFYISSPFTRLLHNLLGKSGKYQVFSTESTLLSSDNTSDAYYLLN